MSDLCNRALKLNHCHISANTKSRSHPEGKQLGLIGTRLQKSFGHEVARLFEKAHASMEKIWTGDHSLSLRDSLSGDFYITDSFPADRPDRGIKTETFVDYGVYDFRIAFSEPILPNWTLSKKIQNPSKRVRCSLMSGEEKSSQLIFGLVRWHPLI